MGVPIFKCSSTGKTLGDLHGNDISEYNLYRNYKSMVLKESALNYCQGGRSICKRLFDGIRVCKVYIRKTTTDDNAGQPSGGVD